MNTRKVKEIIKFDIEKSIQNKWFVILNVVLFISVLLMTNWGNISEYLVEHNIDFLSMNDITIQVLDEEDLIYDSFVEQYKDYENIKIERVHENNYSKENIPDDEIILFEIKTDKENIVTSKIVSKEGIDTSIQEMIFDAIKEARSKVFAENNDITIDELNILNEDPVVERELLGVDAENSETKEMIKMISIIVVYMVLIFVLSKIASEIAQEKVSKSIEYVLTSVSAKEYLIAKVLGSTLTVLIQILYSFVYYLIGSFISSLYITQVSGTGDAGVFNNIDTGIISYVLVMSAYLVFTVFLTTLIQATLSSKTTSVAEAGNTTTLLMFLIIAIYFISIAAISPYITVTPFMYVVSCLPIVSTFFVPTMMIIGQATTAQIVISFIVLILTVQLIFNICAKHFKNGILDYTTNKKKKGLFSKNNKKEESLKEKQEKELAIAKAKKFAFTIGMSMILLIFLETILSFVLSIAMPSILGGELDYQSIVLIENSLISIVAMGLSALFIAGYSYEPKEEPKKLNRKSIVQYVFGGIGIIALIQIGLTFLYEKIGLNYDIFESFNVVPGNGILDKIIYFVSMAVVPAIFEELLFRKAILNHSKKYGNLFAVLFSALLFGLIHMNLNQGIFAFLIGIVFAVIAIRTRSIKIPVLLHFLNNGYAAIINLLEEGTVAYGIFNNIVIAIVIFGVIMLLKSVSKLKEIKKEDFGVNKNCLLILKNYTFIVAMILLVVMFVVTENFLRA